METNISAALEQLCCVQGWKPAPMIPPTVAQSAIARRAIWFILGGLPDAVRQGLTIDFLMVESELMSAHCRMLVSRPNYAIIMSEGAGLLLTDYFCRVMSNPLCFTDIGNVGNETQSDPSVLNVYTDVNMLVEFGLGGSYSLPTPVDPDRRKYAILLTHLALVGIVMHEIAHIVQGHVDLVAARSETLTPRQRRALEDAADRYAVFKTISYAINSNWIGTPYPFISGEKAQMKAVLRALLSLHQFEAEGFYRTGFPPGLRLHPLPRHRDFVIAEAFRFFCERITGRHIDAHELVDAMVECDFARHYISLNHGEADYIEECMTTANSEDLLREWQVCLRPLLTPFSFSQLPTAGPDGESVFNE
jgi:hypothetical protein